MDDNKQQNLTIEQQAKLEKLRHHLPSLRSFLQERNRMMPIIASLSIALLVVFSFDKGLIPITNEELRIIITILLFTVPVSLAAHLGDNQAAITKTLSSINQVIGKNSLSDMSIRKKILGYVMTYIPWLVVSLVSLVMGYVIYIIWL